MRKLLLIFVLIALISTALGANAPPYKASIPRGALCGVTSYSYTYQSKAIDPDGDKVKITFDWGDGTSTTTGLVASGAWVSASHKWPMGSVSGSKAYNIIARATDEHGTQGAWSNAMPISMVTSLPNRPPTVPVISGPTCGVAGSPCQFSFVSTDPDGNKIKYSIHWGDSTSSTGYFPSGQAATVSHTWAVPPGETRSYGITAYAVDEGNARLPYPYRCAPFVVTISGPPVAAPLEAPAIQEEPEILEESEIEEELEKALPLNTTNSSAEL